MQQMYTPKQNYKVLVRCITYNQSKYIVDCLNGFAMQKTTFPFVCLIMDDCSTDGEIEVIKTWMEQECDISKAEYVDLELSTVILVPHRINEYCRFAFYLLKRNLYKEKNLKMYLVKPWRDHCEYEALCEGDDYWIHPQKLQKQVDIMDIDSECALTYTRVKVINGKSFEKGTLATPVESLEHILTANPVVTLTAMIRINFLKEYYDEINPSNKGWKMGDYPIWLYMYIKHKVKYIEDIMGVYRIVQGSASHPKSIESEISFRESTRDITLYFAKMVGASEDIIKKIYDKYYKSCAAIYHRRGDDKTAKKMLKNISRNHLSVYMQIFHPNINDYYNALMNKILSK